MRPREETRDTEEDHEDDKRSRRPLILPEFSLVQGHEAEVEAGEETRETQNDPKDGKRSRQPLILLALSLVQGHEAGEETTDTEEGHQYEWRLPLSNDL